MLNHNTPIEKHHFKGVPVYVKREDLASKPPGPAFSKVRGLLPVLERMKSNGIKRVAYTESAISMAGWGVAWACNEIGLEAIIFDPQFKKTPALLKYHRAQWIHFGATLIPIPAGRVKTGYYISRKIMRDRYPEGGWELLPLGLPFNETVSAATEEMYTTFSHFKNSPIQTVVVAVGSGTVATGVIAGCSSHQEIKGVLCRTGSIHRKLKDMERKGLWTVHGLRNRKKVELIDPGYQYTDPEEIPLPWPCHKYYDAKAAKWMIDNIHSLKPPILFWNIGS
jgi:threonine dehydratase